MNPSRLRAKLLYLLCTVFLAVQWTPAHAHLPTTHQHNGPQHDHEVNAHAHHAGAIDLGHTASDVASVVDLDQTHFPPGCQVADDCSLPPAFVLAGRFLSGGLIPLPASVNPLPQRPPPHLGEPRAPPF